MDLKITPEFIERIMTYGLKKSNRVEDFVEGNIKITKTKNGIVIEIVDFEKNAMFRTSEIKINNGDTVELHDIKILNSVRISEV